MTLRTILNYPDPRLRTLAKPVTHFDDELKTLIDDMFETMYAVKGIGLAATQVDEHIQLVVMDLSEDGSQPMNYIATKKGVCLCQNIMTKSIDPNMSELRHSTRRATRLLKKHKAYLPYVSNMKLTT